MLKRIGIIGGSFDPIHDGHLMIAKELLKQQLVDQVLFVVAKQAPLKKAPIASFNDRVNMVKLASKTMPNTKVCTIEADLPSPSYTIDTVKALLKQEKATYFICIGADQALQLDQWKQIDQLKQLAAFIVFKRPGYELSKQFITLSHVSVDVSSTQIRNGVSVKAPKTVLAYMIMNHLYDQTILSAYLSEKRIDHVNSVTALSLTLAEITGANKQVVQVAATYHDIAKEMDLKTLTDWMNRVASSWSNLPLALWHSFVGVGILKHLYGVKDKAVFSAMQHHILGASASLEAKIVFVADKIEPNRKYDTQSLIELAKKDIHQAVRIVKAQNKQYNEGGGMS